MNLNWALDKEHAEKPEILNDEIVWFDILDFFNYVQPPWTLDLDNLKYESEKKVKKAKEHFESESWMDPCYVMGRICDVHPQHADDKRIMIENRHRLLAALQLGAIYAPVSVPEHLIKELKSAVKFIPPNLLSVSVDSRP